MTAAGPSPPPEPRFTRVGATPFYWLDGAARQIGFLASSGSLAQTCPLSTTWQDPDGVYLFTGVAPRDDSRLIAALPGYLKRIGWPAGPKFLWLDDPDLPVWVGQSLDLQRTAAGWTVRRRADVRLATYLLRVPSGSSVSLGTAEQGWGFVFSGATGPPGHFLPPGGTYDIDGDLLLPLAGEQAGCWRFTITLASRGSPDDFAQLGVGLRFFHPAPRLPGDAGVGCLHLPVLTQPAGSALRLDVALDALRPTDPDRSHLSFFPPAQPGRQVAGPDGTRPGPPGGDGGTPAPGPPTMASGLTTVLGYPARLTPLPAQGSTPDARLVFAVQPAQVGPPPVPVDYYLAPQGAFRLTIDAPAQPAAGGDAAAAQHRLLVGSSGLEYLGVPADHAAVLHFLPGRPAFAPLSDAADQPALTTLGTTSWVWLSADADVGYYAQPEDAPLYRAAAGTGDADVPNFLDYLELPALFLAPQDGRRCFPLAPYRTLPADEVPAALAVEPAIAAARRQALLAADATAWATPAGALQTATGPSGDAGGTSGSPLVGVTPQGLAVGVAADGTGWDWVGIANDDPGSPAVPSLVLTQVSGALRQALATNRLFLVAANPQTFLSCTSVPYRLTSEGIASLRAAGKVPGEVLDAVAPCVGHRYDTEAAFDAALIAASPHAASYLDDFHRQSGLLRPRIGDWSFQLSPRNWAEPDRGDHAAPRPDTMLIFKFDVTRSLTDLVADPSSWTWPEAATPTGGKLGDTRSRLQAILQAAEAAVTTVAGTGQTSPYANFVDLWHDPGWTGILALNCATSLTDLPGPLQALAGGIDKGRCYAHHVGFGLTPFDAPGGVLRFGLTSTFGLIDYADPTDQYFEDNRPYMFKVLRLSAGFRNSTVTSFSSQVELLVNRLFGAPTTRYPTTRGNNLVLSGVHQRRQDASGVEHDAYLFTADQESTFAVQDSALRWVRVDTVDLVTTRPYDPQRPLQKIVTRFQLGGHLHFYEPDGFDPFSYGQTRQQEEAGAAVTAQTSGLCFRNLVVQMQFAMGDPQPEFAFVTETLAFDPAGTAARPTALQARFPLALSGFLSTPDPELAEPVVTLRASPVRTTPTGPAGPLLTLGTEPVDDEESTTPPETLGYVPLHAPVDPAQLRDPWYGLVYDLDLGSLGALADSVPLTVKLLVAWGSGGTRDAPAVYLGLRLPGVADALGVTLPLQGVLTCGFKSTELLVSGEGDHRQYLLRLRNFALRLLGLTFPPGHNDILLAPDPTDPTSRRLGWYAAYARDDDPKQAKLPSRTARLVAARRLPATALGEARRDD
ncbi:hypothetical protein GA0070606_0501 [Micromonospora citrea]|uniref:Uncharacterized protein n=1 Tax=Micromonospora citrea TaxID=47855 RepID=A0A1C6TT76_9ACTN|nr:hypothetical protein [Micromonospora citrea]SCL44888.1 hypothetical protein GA0070606_0501 [Micromonospora citrea]